MRRMPARPSWTLATAEDPHAGRQSSDHAAGNPWPLWRWWSAPGDGRVADLRADRRCRALCERFLARVPRAAVPRALGAAASPARRSAMPLADRVWSRPALLRRRPVLLAPLDPLHHGRQRDLSRHHGADLGRARRLARCSREDRRAHASPGSRFACSAARRCSGRATASCRIGCSATSSGSSRRSSSAATCWPCGRARPHAGAARLAFLSTAITERVLFVIRAVLEPRFMPRSWTARSACWRSRSISQVWTRPARGRARHVAGDLLVAGHLPRSRRRRGLAWLILGEASARCNSSAPA